MNIREWNKQKLEQDEERYRHVLGAEKAAILLAEKFGANPEKAGLAALLHDCAKLIPIERTLDIIKENNIEVLEVEKLSHKTLHAPVGAFLMKYELNIDDAEVLNAVRWHTIGRIEMGILEKIVFLSDKIEAETRSPEYVNKLWNVLNTTNDIDEGLLFCYGATIKSLVKRKMYINSQTIEVWNYLNEKLSKKTEGVF